MFKVRLEQPHPIDKDLMVTVDLELSDMLAPLTRPYFDTDQQYAWVTHDLSSSPFYGPWSVTNQNSRQTFRPRMIQFAAYRWLVSAKQLDILARVDKPGKQPMETVFVAVLEEAELTGG